MERKALEPPLASSAITGYYVTEVTNAINSAGVPLTYFSSKMLLYIMYESYADDGNSVRHRAMAIVARLQSCFSSWTSCFIGLVL